ncbi:putative glycoside hydrolase [Enhygromyxa salina]|uniref:Putative glycoside hydrolase n=2 Tax=Enhygromyxa salina TaxID=215803 RepID=A0A0C2CTI5_9BACT|nr:putative glycoside hydrolase [Enhygromyxa salina]
MGRRLLGIVYDPRTTCMHVSRRLPFPILCLTLACSQGTAHEDTSVTGSSAETNGDGDGDPGDGDGDGDSDTTGVSDLPDRPMPELVDVDHEREFRAVWVATVYNINWPSNSGLDIGAAQAELIDIVETCEAINLNAIVFQVRPESDALYASQLEPWSRYLTGAQGGDPGWDPLSFLIEQAHARNIEVHGWINPYRAAASAAASLAQPHIALQQPAHAHVYNGGLWMDPGAIPVREHVVDVVIDIVDRYDIDGIHLDDYFYPYPDGSPYPDDLTWNQYLQDGGMLALADWRRDNVNDLVEELHDSIYAADPDVRFGIAPFGIYRPGIPEGIVGFDQYAQLYADPLLWFQQGWVDYLAPQLYWPTTYAQQDYEVLLDWWTQQNPSRYVFAGNYLSKLGTDADWTLDEMLLQVELSRLYSDQNSRGNVFFQVQPLLADTLGINAALYDEFYGQPALTPALAERLDQVVAPPQVALSGDSAMLDAAPGQRVRAWVVYAEEGGAWRVDQIVPVDPLGGDAVELGPGRWAITAAGWHNVESQGVVVEL